MKSEDEFKLSDVFNAATVVVAATRGLMGTAMLAGIIYSVTGAEPSPKFFPYLTGALTAAQLAAQLAWPNFWRPKV